MNQWLNKSQEISIKHFSSHESLPIWAAVETLPFGCISKMISLYGDTKTLRQLYRSFDLNANIRTNAQIIHALVYLRNLCAHYCRLWNREMIVSSPILKKMNKQYRGFDFENRSVASIVIAEMYLVDSIDNDDAFSGKIISFLENHQKYAEGIRKPLHWK